MGVLHARPPKCLKLFPSAAPSFPPLKGERGDDPTSRFSYYVKAALAFLSGSLWVNSVPTALPSLPLEGRAGEGVLQWSPKRPPPSFPPLKGEGCTRAAKIESACVPLRSSSRADEACSFATIHNHISSIGPIKISPIAITNRRLPNCRRPWMLSTLDSTRNATSAIKAGVSG